MRSEKRAKLIKEGRCFICCNTGCYVKKCKKEVCSYCKGRHARAICFKLEKSKQNSHLDLEEKNVDVKTTSSNSVFHNRDGVLLQCVQAGIIGRSSSDKIFFAFLIMEVRSRSLKKCVSEVGVENIGFGKAKYFSFGCKTPKNKLVSRLGWSLQGRCDERSDCTSVHLVHSEDESISTELRRFWEIESLGILDKGSMTLGNGDEEILSEFDKSVNFVEGRYRVNLPWKPDFRDRDFTRFFWTDNLNKEPYVLNFTRVLFGLRPSPYLLAATLKHHFKKYREQYPHTFELLNSSIYVDDLICGQNDVPDALRTTLECLQIFSDAGMLLRKWRSNSKQLNLLWQQEGVKTESSETSAIDLRPPTKVLGLAWDPENDLIYFDPKDLLKFMSRRGESKRFILSVVGRIFDPIGILSPFVIKLKCLLQELWTLGVEWDSELPPKLRHKWQQWSSEAEGLTEIKIPRFYLGNIDQEISKCEIHCFSDVSKSAYGTILYLRFVTCNNEIETSFICSKVVGTFEIIDASSS
ncbi:DUF1758 domain-containing protein [Trichonephila clavipes]|nr:DUF1758 domain-containing protein [Trichonephila clavipes]